MTPINPRAPWRQVAKTGWRCARTGTRGDLGLASARSACGSIGTCHTESTAADLC
ncbi:hypothetical protein TIFTF001_019875 [Ficus carica]|uniref:Uncharacterized protein n=1 Tax=Ficus carica TaxID=3494 RepID=A0AA88ATE3_FICCA|nr:hypothetical protein TIFTF001_019875 [Ficus carica]